MTMRESGLRSASLPNRGRAVPRVAFTLVKAVQKFWDHGDLFAGAAISFYAVFSLLPLTILMLMGLTVIFPIGQVERNMGRLFGGLADTDVVLRTLKAAYAREESLGWLGSLTLVLAATGVFGAVQIALDRVWELRGRRYHHRFLVGMLAMTASLLIFLGILVGTFMTFRLIRTSALGSFLGWPRTPPRGASSALSIATGLAQFAIFWTGYRFLPSVPVGWHDAWPGAALAAALWHGTAYALAWYLSRVADFATLYHSLATIMALLLWVYALACSFLLGAEFVAQWMRGPGRDPPPRGEPVR